MKDQDPKSNISPFIAGAIFGATLTLALTHKEGRKLTAKVMESLKEALENFEKNHPDLAGLDFLAQNDSPKNSGHNFPPPPKGYPSRSDLDSYFDK
jgi:hypothetical protein